MRASRFELQSGTLAECVLRFLRDWSLLERVYPRRNRRTEDSIHLSAMVCLHGMAHAEAV